MSKVQYTLNADFHLLQRHFVKDVTHAKENAMASCALPQWTGLLCRQNLDRAEWRAREVSSAHHGSPSSKTKFKKGQIMIDEPSIRVMLSEILSISALCEEVRL